MHSARTIRWGHGIADLRQMELDKHLIDAYKADRTKDGKTQKQNGKRKLLGPNRDLNPGPLTMNCIQSPKASIIRLDHWANDETRQSLRYYNPSIPKPADHDPWCCNPPRPSHCLPFLFSFLTNFSMLRMKWMTNLQRTAFTDTLISLNSGISRSTGPGLQLPQNFSESDLSPASVGRTIVFRFLMRS